MLNRGERQLAIALAKNSLSHYLTQRVPLPFDSKIIADEFGETSDLFKPYGCFVTLKTRQGRLRGCIGTIVSDNSLYSNIINNAISAGTADPRFDPIDENLLETLEFEISVMGALVEVRDLEQIIVGTHGIIVKRGHHQGLLLPQVPIEWKWDRTTFLEETCQKAGLEKGDYLLKGTSLFTFTAEVFSENNIASVTHNS